MCVYVRGRGRETDKANVLLNAGVKAREGVAIETPCSDGSEQYSPFLQPGGTRIFQ